MNSTIIEQFNLLIKQIKAEYLNAQIENNQKEIKMHEFRLKNIKKIADIIKKLDFEITDPSELNGIPGIGKGTLSRIKEILETGHLSEIEQKYSATKQKKITGIQDLTKVIGIGDKVAQKLVLKYKITNVEDLIKAHESGKINLSPKIVLGLKYYGIVKGDIPRSEIESIETYLKSEAHNIDPNLTLVICGSYRRGRKTSGDIDALIYNKKGKKYTSGQSYLELLIDTLTKKKFILDHMTDKNYKTKYMGFCRYKKNPVRRIDIRLFNLEDVPAAMLYFTGPLELNTIMRDKAKKRNMILNEYGIFKKLKNETLEKIKMKSEKDFFDILNMKYLTPEEREGYTVGNKRE